jgi:hypothetical protein
MRKELVDAEIPVILPPSESGSGAEREDAKRTKRPPVKFLCYACPGRPLAR